ncbi:MAG: nickel pincer cofactor biosynthesis protein LarB [Clostridiales Family XIII bacterium]|jgi:NCAIR mutase (PurE)-related protein|nr:nickel pincer cofactor biosynthesis protein LarB [Clostridiales Family XIII bacterium]
MDKNVLQELLRDVADGLVLPAQAAERLKTLPYDDIDFAKLDTHRALRTGRAEVIFGIGKTPGQIAAILKKLAETSDLVIATKTDHEAFAAAQTVQHEGLTYYETAKLLVYRGITQTKRPAEPSPLLPVAVVCAGTADIPVAEEAAITAELYGASSERYYDVGVAGIHRLLDKAEDIGRAGAIIVVAGMEGALASVVGGMASVPVIAVPTSVGYGASMGGLAALLAMLNSCSLGVSVVNIDNGFGAGYLASMIVNKEKMQ